MNKLLLALCALLFLLVGGWLGLSQVDPRNASAVPLAADVHHANRLAGEWLVARSFPLPPCGQGRDRNDLPVELKDHVVGSVGGAVEGLYSWTDASGALHYSDDPADVPTGQRVEKVERLPTLEVYRGEYSKLKAGAMARVKPRAPRRAAQTGGRVTAIVYSAKWCGACKSTKAFLLARGVVVDERDIDEDPRALSELLSLAGQDAAIPVTVLGKKVVGGFDESALAEALRLAR